MKKKLTLFAAVFFILIPPKIFSQSNFSVEAYKQFLISHQNMETDQLLQMKPAGSFISDLNNSLSETRYLDSISIKYGLTEFEQSLLKKNGFEVSERMNKVSFGEAFLDVFQKDLPVFISTDAILHAFHISYDRILKDVETGILIEKLKLLLQTMHSNQNLLYYKYGFIPEMDKMLKDVDIYLTVPLKLFELNIEPYYSDNASLINEILTNIENLQAGNMNLFSETCRYIDWSQFKPRGHYAESEFEWEQNELPQYFKTMMWLGKIELYLISPQGIALGNQSFDDIRRQIIDSYLIKELIDAANSYSDYEEIESAIKIFAGEQDNVTLDNLTYMQDALGFENANDLLDSLTVIGFQDTLKNQSFAQQKILSQILIGDPMDPDRIEPASSFLLFGQRFVIDSYVTGSVVYDKIEFNGTRICRLQPSLLDVLFAIGNSASAQLLQDELNQYHYSTNLASLRYLIDSYDDDFWSANFYSNWLGIIRKLNPPEDRENLPEFMKTAAYWQEKMNTQLASWAELRHDNLLYAKQSYTGGTTCSYPYSYVEPFPEFYESLKGFALSAKDKIQNLNFSDEYTKGFITSYFSTLYEISDTLQTITNKELDGEMLNDQEITFLQDIIYKNAYAGSGDTPYKGWYSRLFYRDAGYFGDSGLNSGLLESNHLVADMHTTPTDCVGGPLGWVKHVGTGPINLGVFITPWGDGVPTAFVGPVMSYYEYTTSGFLRLTDQEWNDQYLQSALRPEWVNIYLADSSGNSRGAGPMLITDVKPEQTGAIIPESEIIIGNYPNPFNSTTLIAFSIPYNLTNENTELKIYNIQGSLVATLVNEQLAAGNYVVKWAGKNQNNLDVASGIYFYNIKVGDKFKSGKMNLLK